jgi:predicted nucleic acid-binding protein
LRVASILRDDPDMVVWWSSRVECASAVARLIRAGKLDPHSQYRARQRLAELWLRALDVEPTSELRERAIRLVNLHPLRAADALQLAAALDWYEERSAGAGFVCLDERLRGAAMLEGFDVLPLSEEIHEP